MKSAYFLSHNGLGDNITNISAINYLLKHYDTIFFLCKDIYQENIKLLFNNKSVVPIAFDNNNEFKECKRIISEVDIGTDCLISGCHMGYLSSRITNPGILNYHQTNKYYIKYKHIEEFYKDIGLDSTIYIDYFDIESTDISKQLFDYIKQFKIIFLHTQGSNRQIDLSNMIKFYENHDDYIIICSNKNVYNKDNSKYQLAEKYVNLKVAHYIDIIKQAEFIHVIDSCFSCIVYPLNLAKKLNARECITYDISST
jgi:hypothetical protein